MSVTNKLKEASKLLEYKKAQQLADEWLPHPNCVMDTAIDHLGVMKVVEFNCLNCSGMYGHDPLKIVKAIQEQS